MKGFTLIEIVMVIVLLSIIAGIGVPLLIAVNDGWLIAKRRNQLSEGARVSIDRMIREMRMVSNLTSVVAANSTRFQFVDISNNNITYDLNNSTIRRTISGTVDILVAEVSSLDFTYYNLNGSTISTPVVGPSDTDIRRIEIDFTLTNSSNLSFFSQVSPRNLNADY